MKIRKRAISLWRISNHRMMPEYIYSTGSVTPPRDRSIMQLEQILATQEVRAPAYNSIKDNL